MPWGPEEHQQGLLAGGDLFRHMVTGGELEPLASTPIPPQPGETTYADLPLEYSRFYGTNESYRQRSLRVSGPPVFIVTALAANVVTNAAARQRAQMRAAPQWREHQVVRTVLSNTRLLVSTSSGWMSFWHRGLVEFLPEPDAFALTLAFSDCEPVMLRGPGVPWLSVAMACQVYPVAELPRMPGFAGMSSWLQASEQPRELEQD